MLKFDFNSGQIEIKNKIITGFDECDRYLEKL